MDKCNMGSRFGLSHWLDFHTSSKGRLEPVNFLLTAIWGVKVGEGIRFLDLDESMLPTMDPHMVIIG